MSLFKSRSLALRMIVLVLGGTIAVFGIIWGYTYYYSRDMLLDEAEANARNLADSMARRIEQEFRALAKVPENMAYFLETSPGEKETLRPLLARLVKDNKEVYGATVAYEPFAFDPLLKAYAPYYYKTPDGLKFAQLGDEKYNYFKWDWYQVPRDLKEPVWTEPYFDEGGGGILMCTRSVPFFWPEKGGAQRKLRGIVTSDLSLEWLSDFISSIRAGQTGYGFLISGTGSFISHPDKALIMRESIFTLADQIHDPALRRIGRSMLQNKSGFVKLDSSFSGGKAFLAYTHIPSTGWSFGVIFPQNELLAEVTSLSQRAGLIAAVGVVALCGVVVLIARSITRPLRRVAEATARVAEGDLEVDLSDVQGEDEVARLAQAFTSMSLSLKQYIKELTETTAAKEKIESELNIASVIQRSILPSTFPPFPQRREFDLWAMMQPAKEVGGDFYDFFFIDDDLLALLIADVSDKGVPAALFMMVSRTLINTIARQDKTPAEVLSEANDLLCQGNDAAMFVTVFLSYYDVKTGRLTYANGGHNPPLLHRADGQMTELPLTGRALGMLEGRPSGEESLTLMPGETLILYTDGVTEAINPAQEEFGLKRLRRTIQSHPDSSAAEMIKHIHEDVFAFASPEPQFDDFTLSILKVNRREGAKGVDQTAAAEPGDSARDRGQGLIPGGGEGDDA